MGKIFNDISDQQVLFFTEAMGQLGQRSATFKTEDQMITPANEKQIMREAEASARAYAEARNRKASPRSLIGEDASLVASVKQWVTNRGKRLRG